MAEVTQEDDLARDVFQRTIGELPDIPGVDHLQLSADKFSGDLVLYRYSPRGDLHLLVGDFTGHGLSAALGAMPTAQIFNSMTSRGFAIDEIIEELNRKLYRQLPTQLFLSAALISYSPVSRNLNLWNLGLPPLLMIDGQGGVVDRFPSRNLPLGLLEKVKGEGAQLIEFPHDRQLLAYSDGLVEMEVGERRFDRPALEKLIQQIAPRDLIEGIGDHVKELLQSHLPADDVTLVQVRGDKLAQTMGSFSESRFNHEDLPSLATTSLAKVELVLEAMLLKKLDLVPLLMGILEQLGVQKRKHRQAVFLILSELINNALEHGLLSLDSRLKLGTNGFVTYMQQRRERLAQLEEGRISLELDYLQVLEGNERCLAITVEDSGPGFDLSRLDEAAMLQENDAAHGRGIALIRKLCSKVDYEGNGNRVKVYYWLN